MYRILCTTIKQQLLKLKSVLSMLIREYIFIAYAIIVIIQKFKKKIFFRVKLIKRTVWWSRFINNLTHFTKKNIDC